MTKATLVALGVALAVGVAWGEPDGSDTPPGQGSGSAGGKISDSLQKGEGQERPWANGVSEADRTAALQLFHDGNEKLNQGLFAQASEKYEAALKHWDHPAIHYNLALTQVNLDQPLQAFDNFTQSIKFGDGPIEKDKLEHAKESLLLLEKQIAEVEVTCNKTGAKVEVDGQPVFTAPGTFKGKVRVGKHTFVAVLEGHPTRVEAPFIGGGEKFRIELKLYTNAELTRYKRRWDTTWYPLAFLAGGVAMAAIGGILEYESSQSYKQYDDDIAACSGATGINGGCSTKTYQSVRDRGDTYKTLGAVGYSIAGAAAVTAGVLWVLNRPQAYEIRPEDMENHQVTVTPTVTPGFAGASVMGRF